MKKRMISLCLAAILCMNFAWASDTDGHWAQDSIAFVTARELFGGVGEGRFLPDEAMTRAMLVTVLWRMSGKPQPAAESGFSDVPEQAWYAPAVAWARERGVADGRGGGFAPDAFVTRAELATLLYRYFLISGYQMEEKDVTLDLYSDAAETPDWAREGVAWAISQGVLNGKPGARIDAQGYATRAECAVMIRRFYYALI